MSWQRRNSNNCLVNWNNSELTWKFLQQNINRILGELMSYDVPDHHLLMSGGIQSSGGASRRCAHKLAWTRWPVGRGSGPTCSILETSTMSQVGALHCESCECRVFSGVQIVEVCMANQHKTGGLMELGEIRNKLVRSRGKSQHHQDISIDDLLRATKKLKILGTGFTVIPLKSGRYLVQSVPGELSLDQARKEVRVHCLSINSFQMSVLEQAEKCRGLVTEGILLDNLKWEKQRSNIILGN